LFYLKELNQSLEYFADMEYQTKLD